MRLATVLGYDPAHLSALTAPQRRALGVVALAAAPGVVVLAIAAGYGAFLASDQLVIAVPVGFAAGAYLANLLRVAVAGGGVAAHQSVRHATMWVPRVVPLTMLALLGVFFAQPLILAVLASEQDAAVEELSAALVAMHEAAVTQPVHAALLEAQRGLEAALARQAVVRSKLEAGDDVLESRAALRAVDREVEDAQRRASAWAVTESRVRADDVEPYRAHLQRSHFLLRRLQLTWAAPVRPVAMSAVMVALMVLPWLASATIARGAHRAYETRRYIATRALVEVAYEESRRQEAAALSRWSTFGSLRAELFADAPYNTKPRSVSRG